MITDTTAEAEKRQREISERQSGEENVRLAMALSDNVRNIARAGFLRRHPAVSEETLQVMFLDEVHGIELPGRSRSQSNAYTG